MIRPVIAIDMDDTVAKFLDAWVKAINEGEGETVKKITNWDIASHFKCGKKIYEYLTYDLYRNLEVIEDSQGVIKKLTEHYDVFFVTSAIDYPESLTAKVEWVKEHYPFIPTTNIVLCGNKTIIKADIMIDDGAHNLENFDGARILYDVSHNRNETRFTRVHNWKNIEELLLGDNNLLLRTLAKVTELGK